MSCKGRDKALMYGYLCVLAYRELRICFACLCAWEDAQSMNKMYEIRDAKLLSGRKCSINK
jgi:hypothetical protein